MGLGEIYKKALNTAIGSQADVYDFSSDFNILWAKNLDGRPELIAKLQDSSTLVIVWDGQKPNTKESPGKAGALLEKHLTPLDWALAFSIQAIESKIPPAISIHIIDLTAKQFEDAWAIRMRHQLLADMPWVRLYTPLLPDESGPFVTHEAVMSLDGDPAERTPLLIESGGSWQINKKVRSRTITSSANSRRLKDLATQWASSLTQSNDHHDVNNIIGPDILAGTAESRPGLPGAFLTKLAWSCHDLKQASDWKSWNTNAVKKDLFDRSLSVLVVDDQLEQGWGRFVCKLFGCEAENSSLNKNNFTQLNKNGQSKITVWGCLGSEPIINFLGKTTNFDKRNFTLRLKNDDHCSPNNPEIIFLDLRLYTDPDDERKAATALNNIAQKLPARLAWTGITQEETARIKDWLLKGNSQETRTCVEALLLLPRLLALALPLTPIILFSSTRQSWIKERLKAYRNIFTGFEKPRVLSNQEAVSASISALHDGLDKALMMMRLRLQLEHAHQAAKKVEELRAPILSGKTQNFDNKTIEIYADETRILEQGILSGLAICCYTPNKDIKLQKKFEQEHGKQNGVIWATNSTLKNCHPVLMKGKDAANKIINCNQQVIALDKLLNDVNLLGNNNCDRALWSVVATRVEKNIPETKTENVSLAAFPDGPLDNALRFNLEFTLFVLIPFFTTKEFNGKIHVYLPSRLVALDSSKADIFNYANSLCEAFDLGRPTNRKDQYGYYISHIHTSNFAEIKDNNNKNVTYRLGTAFPQVRGWLHDWRVGNNLPSICRKIKKINMAVLGQKNGITPDDAKKRALFHDIADWVCTASNPDVGSSLKTELSNKKIFPNWFVSTDTKKNGKDKEWFIQDTKNAMILMQALQAQAKLTDDERSGSKANVLRIALRNSYIAGYDSRLIRNECCAQQRLILWALRDQLQYASGNDLHALLVDVVGQPASDATMPEVQIPSEPDDVELSANETTTDEQTDSSIMTQQEGSGPEMLTDQEIATKFSSAKRYLAAESCHTRGIILFKMADSSSNRMTHSISDRSVIQQLQLDGWSSPMAVLGEEIPDCEETHLHTKPLRILAGKLLNGKWQELE